MARGSNSSSTKDQVAEEIARVLGAEVAEVRPATVWKHCSDKEWEFKLLLMDLRR